MLRKGQNPSCSQTLTTTLFHTKSSKVSQVRAMTNADSGDEKAIGVVPTLIHHSLRS